MTEVIATDESRDWFAGLDETDAEAVTASVELIEKLGATVPSPHSSAINGSRYAMRELRPSLSTLLRNSGDVFRAVTQPG